MSDNLGLTQLVQSQANKEVTINDQAAELDAALTDLVTVDLTGATSPLALTDTQALRAMVLKLIGNHPGGAFTIEVPANRKLYVVWNTTGETVTVAPSGGSGVEVEDTLALVYCDGTDVLAVASGGAGGNSLTALQAVRVATTAAAGTLAGDFEAGDVVDGVMIAEGDRVLIKDQADAAENGIYVVAASGAPARAPDFDEADDLQQGAMVLALEGAAQALTLWALTTGGPYTIDSTALTFEQVQPDPTFLGLADTPASFAGQALRVLRANAGESALEFVALPFSAASRVLDATGDGSTTGFTLSTEPFGQLMVFLDGVLQNESAWSLVTTTLTFTAAPPAGVEVVVYDVGSNAAAANVPYDLGLFLPGTAEDGAVLAEVVFTRDVSFPDDFAGAQLFARTAATASTVLDLQKNGASVGTVTIGAGAQTGTFATTAGAVSCTAGDRLAVVNQSPADATLADISITLKGTRTS